jgi:hypothetical protein
MEQDTPVTVTRRVDARALVSETCAVDFPMLFHYDAMDPYAVTATFLVGDGVEVDWVLARDLLADGLHRRTGNGDVVICPSSGAAAAEVELMLSVPEGRARVTLPAETLAAFLQATHHVVPPGSESAYLDLETTIVQLLSH